MIQVSCFLLRIMALSREGGSSPSPTRQEEESPKNKSTPFSISAILSEDVGPKKSNAAGGVDKQLSTVENGGGGGGSPISTISLSQAANLMMSPVGGSTMIRPGTHLSSYIHGTHSYSFRPFLLLLCVHNNVQSSVRKGKNGWPGSIHHLNDIRWMPGGHRWGGAPTQIKY